MPEEVVAKARIVNLKTGDALEVHFNPEEFTIGRAVNWNSQATQGHNAPKLAFGGGETADMTLTLLFDTTATGDDVRDSYELLTELALVDPDKPAGANLAEPPKCRFEWGKFLSFEAVVTDLKQQFIMFRRNGTPLRARITVTFKQLTEPVRGQNPTSRGEARKIHIVTQGETLTVIAYQEYGDPAFWRYIAETNDLPDPKVLLPGQALKLLPLP